MEFHKIKEISVLKEFLLEVIFENGKKKKYDVKPIIEKYENFKELEKKGMFFKAKVDKGGYAVIWDEKLDISSEELWNNGK